MVHSLSVHEPHADSLAQLHNLMSSAERQMTAFTQHTTGNNSSRCSRQNATTTTVARTATVNCINVSLCVMLCNRFSIPSQQVHQVRDFRSQRFAAHLSPRHAISLALTIWGICYAGKAKVLTSQSHLDTRRMSNVIKWRMASEQLAKCFFFRPLKCQRNGKEMLKISESQKSRMWQDKLLQVQRMPLSLTFHPSVSQSVSHIVNYSVVYSFSYLYCAYAMFQRIFLLRSTMNWG